jgi:hypothetical protein
MKTIFCNCVVSVLKEKCQRDYKNIISDNSTVVAYRTSAPSTTNDPTSRSKTTHTQRGSFS